MFDLVRRDGNGLNEISYGMGCPRGHAGVEVSIEGLPVYLVPRVQE